MPRGFMSRTTEVYGRALDPPVAGSLLYSVNASERRLTTSATTRTATPLASRCEPIRVAADSSFCESSSIINSECKSHIKYRRHHSV